MGPVARLVLGTGTPLVLEPVENFFIFPIDKNKDCANLNHVRRIQTKRKENNMTEQEKQEKFLADVQEFVNKLNKGIAQVAEAGQFLTSIKGLSTDTLMVASLPMLEATSLLLDVSQATQAFISVASVAASESATEPTEPIDYSKYAVEYRKVN
jgi:hypothetical protein